MLSAVDKALLHGRDPLLLLHLLFDLRDLFAISVRVSRDEEQAERAVFG